MRITVAGFAAFGLVTGIFAGSGAQAATPAGDGVRAESGAAAARSITASAPAAESARSGPGGEPWVVSLGDSYISGEAGRWAGNESGGTRNIDALGGAAYWDAGTSESIRRCHRSASAAIHIGVVKSMNLACSGAITSTQFDGSGNFKPGIDFYNEAGRKGQALMLQEFASEHNVKMVALSISGNDFNFGPIVEACVKAFLVPLLTPHCKDDATVQSYLSAAAQQTVRHNTANAILNVAQAMENAGYDNSDWTLVLQLYPTPLPTSANMRYSESGYSRQYAGGCGLRDGDLDWALGIVLPMINATYRGAATDAQSQRPTLQVAFMDTSRAFADRELCQKAVSRVNSTGGVPNWSSKGAADRSEWVMEINIINAFETYQQESMHPNYWGQLALRNCYRQVWNGGNVQGGACERAAGGGVTADCEPRMTLVTTGGRTVAPAIAKARANGKARVVLRCPGMSMKPGEESVLRGRVTPAGAAKSVTYQMRSDGGAWKSMKTSRISAKGHYNFGIRIPRSAPTGRTYKWRVVATNGTVVVAVSQTRTVLVR